MSVSSDSVQPASPDVVADVTAEVSERKVSAARTARAVDALALAERAVRWEDDVSASELQLFCSLYADAVRMAREELGQAEEASLAVGSRDALLQLRYQACELVRRAEQARRRAQPAVKIPWARYLAGALVLVLIALFAGRDRIAEQLDLGNVSRGKTWVASSRYANDVGLSGTLGDFSAPFFFHTAYEANPWIEIDLGAETPVRSVTVWNRVDCCANRSLPLVIETSLDHQHWQVAATHNRNFARWIARLDSDRARWVRLRTARESHLHLKGIVVRK